MSRTRSAVLWGIVGVFAFLVLVQGFRLVVGPVGIGVVPIAGVAVGVGGFVTAVSFVFEPRLLSKGRN